MATVNLGRIKPVFKNAWANGTTYAVDDFVVHGNECYICIQAGAGQNPTSASAYWTKIAAKGTDGTNVATTITTQGDILYRDGSGLQRLAKGTANQLLRINSGATAPEWATVAGGAFGQFVFATDGTNYSNSNQSNYVRATNTKILITPSSASKTIFVCFNFGIRTAHSDSSFEHRIVRIIGGTETTIRQSSGSFSYHYHGSSSSGNWYRQESMFLTDTPNTTSEVTYTVEFKNPHRTDAVALNENIETQMMAYEIN